MTVTVVSLLQTEVRTLCINCLLRPLAPALFQPVKLLVRLQLVEHLAQLPVPRLPANLQLLGHLAQVLVHPQNPPLLDSLTHFQPSHHQAAHRTTMALKLPPLRSTGPSVTNLASSPCPRVLATFLLPPLLQHSGNKQKPVKSVLSALERLTGADYSSCIILYREIRNHILPFPSCILHPSYLESEQASASMRRLK